MRIVSWNVAGYRSVVNKDFENSMNSLNPDIICLQEVKCLEKEIFVSKFLNKFRLINSDMNQIRMIDEHQLFSNLELLPLQFNNFLPQLISRFGFLNVI